MGSSEFVSLILRGLLNTTLIVVLSSILPLIVGVVTGLFSHKFPVSNKFFGWLSIFFECCCPPILLLTLYYGFYSVFKINIDISALIIVPATLSICFLGYMPSRYNEKDSLLKNILFNGLGLISAIFKWSFCAALISGRELLNVVQIMVMKSYQTFYYIPLFFFVAFVILILEIGRRLIKQFMK